MHSVPFPTGRAINVNAAQPKLLQKRGSARRNVAKIGVGFDAANSNSNSKLHGGNFELELELGLPPGLASRN